MSSLEDWESLVVQHRWDTWFETYGVIRDAEGEFRGHGHALELEANYLQTLISEIVEWCEKHELPVRLLVLKPRQRGCSTFSTAGLYQDANKRPINGVIIGAKEKQAKNLFKMITTYSGNDKHDWGTKRDCRAQDATFKHSDGRESEIGILSAKEYDPGRSGTYQWVLATEAARWSEDGVANAGDVLSGLMKCVQLKPNTVICLETTAAGASGDYHERWGDALEPEEFKARHLRGELVAGSYIRVFAPWYKFPDLSIELTPEQKDRVRETLNKVERYNSPDFGNESSMIGMFGLSLEQIAWRRLAIDKECKRDPRVFEQDYPSTWQSAFLTSGNRRFNQAGIRSMQKTAKAKSLVHGVIEPSSSDASRMVWRPTDENEGLIHRWEEPRPGERYLIAVDVATGASQTQGADPDRHSVFVLKAGRWVPDTGWQRPAAVARIKSPCRWDIDLLAEWIRRLHHYYRGAMIVPEINNPGLALLEVMKPWGLPIIHREVYDEFERRFDKKAGWQTTPKTKPMVISTLARAIREYDVEGDGLEVYDENALSELSTFVHDPETGKEEAMNGSHDDDVMALAIGLTNIDAAVTYVHREEARALPPELERALNREQQSRTGRSMYS